MKIELATIICSKQEIPWLDFGLESILDKTKNDINITLYLSRYTDHMFEECAKVAEKYSINFEPRGDNYPIGYVNESKHIGFDLNNADCVMSLQPDMVFTNKHAFDNVINEAADNFDSKYAICVSTDNPLDFLPMGIVIHTKLGWDLIGCEDVNYYPCGGVENDWHIRCYLEYGFDLKDKKKYKSYSSGLKKDTPEWVHRICAKDCLHLDKDFTYDKRLGNRSGGQFKLIDYTTYILGVNIIHENHGGYHMKKWGASYGDEIWTHPYNNPNYPRKIEWKDSHKPYGLSPYLRGNII